MTRAYSVCPAGIADGGTVSDVFVISPLSKRSPAPGCEPMSSSYVGPLPARTAPGAHVTGFVRSTITDRCPGAVISGPGVNWTSEPYTQVPLALVHSRAHTGPPAGNEGGL